MAKDKTLQDLFLDTLKDIYFAEKKILTALAQDGKGGAIGRPQGRLPEASGETEQPGRAAGKSLQVDRRDAKAKTCDAIMGILDEGKEIMDEYQDMPALDAGLLAAAQAVEHYEISRYGTLKCWAGELGYNEAVKLLDATLAEEKKTDAALSKPRRKRSQHARADGASRIATSDAGVRVTPALAKRKRSA